jgi:hypothetical protein
MMHASFLALRSRIPCPAVRAENTVHVSPSEISLLVSCEQNKQQLNDS